MKVAQTADKIEEKKKPKTALIIIIVMGLIIIIGAVTAVFMIKDIKIADIKEIFEKYEEHVMPMEKYVVNLRGNTTKSTYLKVGVSLLYVDKDYTEILNGKSSQIRDIVIANLMVYTPGELLEDGGIDGAKVKIRGSINEALGEEIVMGIYFTEFLIQ